MKRRSTVLVSAALFAGLLASTAAQAQDALANFYRGRNVSMIIG